MPHSRVRTGCWTCRDAGYKCDEKKPHCGRCVRLGLKCQGYGVRLKWRIAATDAGPEKRPRKSQRKTSPSDTSNVSPISDIASIASAPERLEYAGYDAAQPWMFSLSPMVSSSMASDLPPTDQRLLCYWVDQLSSLISVTPRTTNPTPFQLHLTSMACNYGALRSTILCMAANHLALVSNDASLRVQAYRHQRNAILLLQNLIQDPVEAASEPALATVLMMQVSARLFSEEDEEPHVANHLAGAKAMIVRRGNLHAWSSSSSARFLLSLFAYHDILSSVSLASRPLLENHNEFDGLEGVSSMRGIAKILHIVAQISEMRHMTILNGNQVLPSKEALLLGSRLQQLLAEMDLSGLADNPDLYYTTQAYRHSAFIYLYRVWLGIGAPNPNTLQHVKACINYIEKTPVHSPLVSAHIWPLFSAGCEAIDSMQRQMVRDRFAAMFRSRKFPSLRRVMRDVEDVWVAKDMEQMMAGEDGMSRVDCIQVILRSRGREVDLA
ncbi:hypothetical protein BS50DRAFT_572758 [Corynespora cassiicola Philippines]|uniref:Zn(2)-C6 fungal-type domain-containing protein n=1 Tax=Corynespora cassiicola Philippines TaxID=1448308 RepID=A0A2T2NQN4_CORCC|nr:hypothetical protein BS50DRAFT_572758 [Corynespora cassiicola Philippines]